jgi:hypothetical protein
MQLGEWSGVDCFASIRRGVVKPVQDGIMHYRGAWQLYPITFITVLLPSPSHEKKPSEPF